MGVRIDHVAIPARDAAGAARFLAGLLGRRVRPDGPDGEFQSVVLDDGATLLFTPSAAPVAAQHVALRVAHSDFDGIVARLRASNRAFGNDPEDLTNARTDDPLGGFGRVYFVDPEGHLFEVCATLPATLRRGDVFWMNPDDALEASSGYSHPHVIVQDDVFNDSRITTVVVCALTSNLHRAHEPGNVLLEVGEGNLPMQSVVVVSQIASVEKTRLRNKIGALSEARVDQILTGLRFQQAAFFGR